MGLRATSAAKTERLFRQVRKLAKGGSFLVNDTTEFALAERIKPSSDYSKRTSDKGLIAGI